jgi:hypothetical protein
MSQQVPAKLIVNGVGAVAALIVVGWLGYTAFDSDEAAVCEGRYPSSTLFALTSGSGETVSLSELQARIGSREWGLLQNARIIEPEASGQPPVLAVTLGKGTSAGYKPDQTRGGIGFSWTPADMRDASPKAACLTYRVFLPNGFKNSIGGTLPGLAIGAAFDPRGEAIVGEGAAVRPGWNREGNAYVNVQYATAEGWKNPTAISSKTRWPVGRWVTVEQEVILNDVGKKNGVVRLWLDGAIAGENKKLALRGEEGLAMAGVIADAHYGSITNLATAPEDAEIRLSPFVVRWQ